MTRTPPQTSSPYLVPRCCWWWLLLLASVADWRSLPPGAASEALAVNGSTRAGAAGVGSAASAATPVPSSSLPSHSSSVSSPTKARDEDRYSLLSFTDFKNEASKGAAQVRCGHQLRSHATFERSERITGGKPATINEFPWIVTLQREKSFWFGFKSFAHFCGGSIITPSWIVTAAHCLYNQGDDQNTRVIAGVDNMNFLYRAQVRTPGQLIIHPQFDQVDFDNDIALIKVDKPFTFEGSFSHVAPVCLDRNLPTYAYDIALICGFGSKSYKKRSQTHLYKTEIAIIDQRTCNVSFDNTITNNMICAGGMIKDKRDACTGDSGGPMMLENQGHLALVGIVSFGNECATAQYPGVYTRLNSYYDWILRQIDEPLPLP